MMVTAWSLARIACERLGERGSMMALRPDQYLKNTKTENENFDMNLEIYKPEITVKSKSVLSGETEKILNYDDEWIQSMPILKAWIEDDEIQQIQIVSTNIGFIKTFTKSYK